jgi:uridine kinase
VRAASLDDVLAAIRDRRAALGRTLVVALSGFDCAGKSTLAAALASRLEDAVVFPCDELTCPRAERYANPDQPRGYYAESFAYDELFAKLLPALRSGERVDRAITVSDWEHEAWKQERLVIEPRAIVLVGGVFLLTRERADAFDLRLWIDLPLDAVLPRALQRPSDLEHMGGPEGVRARYEARFLPGQALHVERDDPRGRADLLVPPDLPL